MELILQLFEQLLTKNKKNNPFEELEREKITIDIYRALFKEYDDTINAVFGGYKRGESFVIPDQWLSLAFVNKIKILKIYQEQKILSSLPPFTFDDYCNLEINHEGMIRNIPSQKEKILKYRAKIEELFYAKCKMEGNLPVDVVLDMAQYEDLLKKHKEKRNYKHIDNEVPNIEFTANKSERRSLYNILNSNRNSWIDKKIIMNKLKMNYDDFRSIITQLRVLLLEQKLSNDLSIENDTKGHYKLSDLAS